MATLDQILLHHVPRIVDGLEEAVASYDDLVNFFAPASANLTEADYALIDSAIEHEQEHRRITRNAASAASIAALKRQGLDLTVTPINHSDYYMYLRIRYPLRYDKYDFYRRVLRGIELALLCPLLVAEAPAATIDRRPLRLNSSDDFTPEVACEDPGLDA